AHEFHAVSFEESLPLREVARGYARSRLTPHELCVPVDESGVIRLYPFGSVVFQDVGEPRREAEIAQLQARHKLTLDSERETLVVTERPAAEGLASPQGCTVGL